MLHLIELWRQELDKNRTGGVLFIDFKKAFDSICLEAMALKFQDCGLSGNLYNLIVDYLSGRKRYVEIAVYLHRSKPLISLVPFKLPLHCFQG